MRGVYTVVFTNSRTQQVLRRFDYPAHALPNKFYWEKVKAEELSKLLKKLDLTEKDVKVTDYGHRIQENVAAS